MPVASYDVCGCERAEGPHVHLPKIDETGRSVGAVWDEPPAPGEAIERRLNAVEIHIQELAKRVNDLGRGD